MESPEVTFLIARMDIQDLPQVLAIENASFPVPFSENLFRMELKLDVANLYVARETNESPDARIIGYIDYWHVEDEFHLITFAVHPASRRRHVGEALMNFMLEEAHQKTVKKITLDVRPSNTVALALYAKLGFRQIAVRKGYYSPPPLTSRSLSGGIKWREPAEASAKAGQDNQEDALVLSLEIH